MIKNILATFGIDADQYYTEKFGSGLINSTWKIQHKKDGQALILQKINKQVFKDPTQITQNLSKAGRYLASHHPGYLFISALPTPADKYIVEFEGEFYRLMPFVAGSITINAVETPKQAFEAARQFARFAAVLSDFDIAELTYTIPDFHNLSYRFREFEDILEIANPERLKRAAQATQMAIENRNIAEQFQLLVQHHSVPLRVMHHDTKINNVLFNKSDEGLCVIDLDTVMPGYFISDTGDMMRTYLSSSNEEEKDLSKIIVREEIFAALAKGYFSEMGAILTPAEKSLFYYSGKFMMYMQGLRFLTDYLNDDKYYGSAYPGHNLSRAMNQFTLLRAYQKCEQRFEAIIEAI